MYLVIKYHNIYIHIKSIMKRVCIYIHTLYSAYLDRILISHHGIEYHKLLFRTGTCPPAS